MEKQIKALVLKMLLQAGDSPMTEEAIKAGVRQVFAHVAFPEDELSSHVRECERAGWIAGTRDDLVGTVWALTSKGKIRAQQL